MTDVQQVPYLVLEDFLDAADHDRLIELVRTNVEFSPAHVDRPDGVVDTADVEVRDAQVATPDDDVFALFEDRLRALLPHVRRETGVPHFRLGHIERQITAHRDSGFFDVHSDLGEPWRSSIGRRVSWVYYFHEHPKRFEGGELRLYDETVSEHGVRETADSFQTIEPTDNSIVFFPSAALHEVRPVHVAGEDGQPGTTRFTVNGWFHDDDVVLAAPPLDRVTRTNLTERFTPSFTEHGFAKVRTPSAVHRALRAVYDERIEATFTEAEDTEFLPTGSPDFIDIDDVKGQYHFALQSMHEDWSGQELIPTAAYGLRVYREGQTLLPHTDVLETHVISGIVHIAHDTDEPWPLWIKDLDGVEHEVVLEEGETLLYESARCPHGRPTPLKGRAYCSLFVHYQPVDWDVTYRSLLDLAVEAGDLESLPPELHPPAADR